jgi:hypothetical protein
MSTIIRARLFATNRSENNKLEVSFNDSNLHCVETAMVATTFNKSLGKSTQLTLSTDQKQGSLPIDSTFENGTVSFSYYISKSEVTQLAKVRRLINLMGSLIDDNNGLDVDTLVMLEFEDPNGLTTDFNTYIGEHKKYLKVINITESDGGSFSDIGTMQGDSKFMPTSEINIKCTPVAYGIKEKFGYSSAGLFAVNSGVVMGSCPNEHSNLILNPSFSADVLMQNWTYSPTDLIIKRLEESDSLIDNDVLITNISATDQDLTVTIDGGQPFQKYYLSFLVNSDFTTDDARFVLNVTEPGFNLTTSPYGDYKLYFTSFSAAAPFTCGLRIKPNKQVRLAHSQLATGDTFNSHPYPISTGDLLGYKWEGTPHASNTQIEYPNNTAAVYEDIDWLEKNFTLNLWVTPLWIGYPLNFYDAILFEYTNTHGFIKVIIEGLTGDLKIECSAVTFSIPITPALSYNTPTMFTFVKTTNDIKVHVNTAYLTSIATELKDFLGVGNLAIGERINAVLDGFMIADRILPLGDIETIYDSQLAIKNEGGSVSNGLPIFSGDVDGLIGNYTGFNSLNSSYQTAKNRIVILGAKGDSNSEADFTLKAQTNPDIYRMYINLLPNSKQFNYNSTFFLDFGGADATDNPAQNYSVNDEYWSPSSGPVPPKNSLQPGETVSIIYSVGGGGQSIHSQVQIATQRPKLLNGKLTILLKAIHVFVGGGAYLFSTNLIYSSGAAMVATPITGLTDGLSDESFSAVAGYAERAYGTVGIVEKTFLGEEKDLKFGVQFTNAISSPDKTYCAVDTIHIIKNAKLYLFSAFNSINKTLSVKADGSVIVRDSNSNIAYIGTGERLAPFPDKYIYLGISTAKPLAIGSKYDEVSVQIRDKFQVSLTMRPTYKF